MSLFKHKRKYSSVNLDEDLSDKFKKMKINDIKSRQLPDFFYPYKSAFPLIKSDKVIELEERINELEEENDNLKVELEEEKGKVGNLEERV